MKPRKNNFYRTRQLAKELSISEVEILEAALDGELPLYGIPVSLKGDLDPESINLAQKVLFTDWHSHWQGQIKSFEEDLIEEFPVFFPKRVPIQLHPITIEKLIIGNGFISFMEIPIMLEDVIEEAEEFPESAYDEESKRALLVFDHLSILHLQQVRIRDSDVSVYKNYVLRDPLDSKANSKIKESDLLLLKLAEEDFKETGKKYRRFQRIWEKLVRLSETSPVIREIYYTEEIQFSDRELPLKKSSIKNTIIRLEKDKHRNKLH